MSARVRKYLADFAQARESHFDNISRIRRGDSDGEVSILYSHDLLEEPLEIQVLSTDVTSYPEGSSFMFFTSSEPCHPCVLPVLERMTLSTKGSTLQQVVTAVSAQLTANLENADAADCASIVDSDEDGPLDAEVYDEEYCEFLGAAEAESFEEEDDFLGQSAPGGFRPDEMRHSSQRLYRDLKMAQEAGLTVGLCPNQSNYPIEAISLSIRASKLDITPEAMSAWGITAEDYVVLLVRLAEQYYDLQTLLEPLGTTPITFRFGKCGSAKPSITSVRSAFNYCSDINDNSNGSDCAHDSFSTVYMSKPIDVLFEDSFFNLLKLRRKHGNTWDEAQAKLKEFAGRVASNAEIERITGSTRHPSQGFRHGPSSLQHDYALDEDDKVSLPLVAMQFALRRFCACAEYCMVCHIRLQTDFKPLRPYVCSSGLCAYQYLSLGLGPDIEHEVIHQPYVVDLLISFFHIGVRQGGIRDFPRELALKAPRISDQKSHVNVKANFRSKEIQIIRTENEQRTVSIQQTIQDGDWFTLLIKKGTDIEKHTCRVSAVLDGGNFIFEAIAVEQLSHMEIDMALKAQKLARNLTMTEINAGWQAGIISRWNHDLHDPDSEQGVSAMIDLLSSIPSMLQMRKYLLANPTRTLSSWSLMNRSALSLMRWIVASNTSYIVQDGPVPAPLEVQGAIGDPKTPMADTQRAKPNAVPPLVDGWMQFRFAQGSPEKEYMFLNTLRDLKYQDLSTAKPPSLFVWHGSPVKNWHSIIRTGLDFQTSQHGRAYGHGVYFSSYMSVSQGYCSSDSRFNINAPQSSGWKGSELRVKTALSICEIVNMPEKFVSSQPYFVVDKTDWIQCRYLLVQVDPTTDALKNCPFTPSSPPCADYVEQDLSHPIRVSEQSEPLQIPMTAISAARRGDALSVPPQPAVLNIIASGVLHESVESNSGDAGDDISILIYNEAETDTPVKGQKRQYTTPPEMPCKSPKISADREKSVVSGSSSPRPGNLDCSEIPQIPIPPWATTSPGAVQNLARELKVIHKLQLQEDPARLGWSVDTSSINNLFQWIVQFHSFDPSLPLAKDMQSKGIKSIIMELRFGPNFPMSPPFVRVIRPRFLPFLQGGGGHVTAGGAICSEMLTNSGWTPAISMESVFIQIRLGICDTERPARLAVENGWQGDYGITEAVDAYIRAATAHGWNIPEDLKTIH